MVSARFIQSRYKFWSKIYDSIIDKVFHFDRSKIIKKLDIKRGDKILELGIGTGLNLKYYPAGCTVYGIDFSQSMLNEAKKKKSKAKVILQNLDATKLSFKPDFFDKVLATYVLRIAPDPYTIISKLLQITKNQARFVILDTFKGDTPYIPQILQKISRFLGWGMSYYHKDWVKGTPWKVIHNEKMGRFSTAQLVVLSNDKHPFVEDPPF